MQIKLNRKRCKRFLRLRTRVSLLPTRQVGAFQTHGFVYLSQLTSSISFLGFNLNRRNRPTELEITIPMAFFALLFRYLWLVERSGLVHHVATFSVFLPCLHPSFLVKCDSLIPSFLIIEISTICLNFTKLSGRVGMRDSTFNEVSSLLFAITFFLIRIVWLPFNIYNVLQLDLDLSPVYQIGMLILGGIQFYWFYGICVIAKRNLSGKDKQIN